MEKKQIKIPGYFIAIVIIIVLSAIFLFVVMVPFLQQKPDYDEKHASAESEKASLNPYIRDKDEIQAKITKMKEEYNKKNKVLFEDEEKAIDEVINLLEEFKELELQDFNLQAGQVDGSGITTVEGGALKSSGITLILKGTRESLIKVLDYIEIKTNATFYIDSFTEDKKTEEVETEDGQVSKTTSPDDRFNFTLNIRMYYFEDVTGLSDEINKESEVETSGEKTDASTVSAA